FSEVGPHPGIVFVNLGIEAIDILSVKGKLVCLTHLKALLEAINGSVLPVGIFCGHCQARQTQKYRNIYDFILHIQSLLYSIMLINGSISANNIKLRSYPACEQSGHHSVRSIQI